MDALEQTVLLLTAAFPLMGSPGPANLSLAATGTAYGLNSSLRYLAGIIAGTVSILLMVATGVVGIVLAIPLLAPVLTAAGLCYIAYLAYRIATAPVVGASADTSVRPSTTGGFLLAVANPKAFAAIGAVYTSVALVPESPLVDAALKVAILACMIVVVTAAWLVLGAAFARFLRRPLIGRLANIGFAVLLIASVVGVAARLLAIL